MAAGNKRNVRTTHPRKTARRERASKERQELLAAATRLSLRLRRCSEQLVRAASGLK